MNTVHTVIREQFLGDRGASDQRLHAVVKSLDNGAVAGPLPGSILLTRLLALGAFVAILVRGSIRVS